jgi:pimeloyl-ACP methyl ester carboxylesterase
MNATLIHSADKGDQVICLHSSMSSSRQWEGLMKRLQHSYRVTAVDLHGYGHGPELAAGTTFSLDREVEILTDVVDQMDGPIHLVGHSYGGAVAIKAAQVYGRRVRSLTLYEPVVFSALFSVSANQPASVEVSRLIEDIQSAYRCGDLFHAAQRFIDYWSGPGTWENIPMQKKLGLSKKIPVVLENFEALVSEPNTLAELASIQVPTLYLSGRESPASVQVISELLIQKLPRVDAHQFPGLGHMGPITHSEIVNDRIEGFIQRQTATEQQKGYPLAA